MSTERERVAGFGRLEDGLRQASDWYLWGPYVSERQWGTVREDYSPDGEAWGYLPHDHARSRQQQDLGECLQVVEEGDPVHVSASPSPRA